MKNWELFVAFRYVFSRKREKFTGIISTIAIIGVTLSVCALTVVNAVITGFKEAVIEKVLSLNPHISITFLNSESAEQILKIVKAVIPEKEIKSLCKTASVQGLLVAYGEPVGIMLKATKVSFLKKEKGFKFFKVDEKILKNPSQNAVPVVIGKKLKDRLGLVLGEKIKFITAKGILTPFGFLPKVMILEIAGFFETGVYDYDIGMIYAPFKNFIAKFHPDTFTFEIKLKDPFKSHIYEAELLGKLGYNVSLLDWQDWNRNLFTALKMEKLGLFVVLSLMVAVSLFTILAAMIMLVSEKKVDIAILRALGANSRSILKIFFYSGLILAGTGVFIGLLLGTGICVFLSHYPIVKLPGEVYPVEYMPVKLKISDILLISLVATFISLFACIYPAKKAGEIAPADILRHG
jgi:lipoprotein-releasing system permease protein